MTAPRYVIGVDPGITGALALLQAGPSPRLIEVADMPTATKRVNSRAKQHIIAPALADLLKRWTDLPFEADFEVFIEEVHAMPGQGVTSMFRFGHAAGLVHGVAAGLGLRISEITPRDWQTVVRVRSDPDAGRLRASQLFPLMAGEFARKKDHNRADATLIGYAGAVTNQ